MTLMELRLDLLFTDFSQQFGTYLMFIFALIRFLLMGMDGQVRVDLE